MYQVSLHIQGNLYSGGGGATDLNQEYPLDFGLAYKYIWVKHVQCLYVGPWSTHSLSRN